MAKASQVVLLENEFYLIKAPNGKVLEIKNFNTENGAAIRLWDYAGTSVAAVAVRGCWRGTLADQEPLYRQVHRSGPGRRGRGHRAAPVGPHQRAEPVLGAGVHPGAGRTRIRNVLADKYIDLVGMNTSNGAQAQIWNYVSGGNQEWNLVRVDPDTAQTSARAEEKRDPEPTPSQRKHQN